MSIHIKINLTKIDLIRLMNKGLLKNLIINLYLKTVLNEISILYRIPKIKN